MDSGGVVGFRATPGLAAAVPDHGERAVQVGDGLWLDGDAGYAGLDERRDQGVRAVDLQVGVYRQVDRLDQRGGDAGPHGQVRDEVVVHDVEVDELRPAILRPAHLLRQVREVRRQDRGRANDPPAEITPETQNPAASRIAADGRPFYRKRRRDPTGRRTGEVSPGPLLDARVIDHQQKHVSEAKRRAAVRARVTRRLSGATKCGDGSPERPRPREEPPQDDRREEHDRPPSTRSHVPSSRLLHQVTSCSCAQAALASVRVASSLPDAPTMPPRKTANHARRPHAAHTLRRVRAPKSADGARRSHSRAELIAGDGTQSGDRKQKS